MIAHAPLALKPSTSTLVDLLVEVIVDVVGGAYACWQAHLKGGMERRPPCAAEARSVSHLSGILYAKGGAQCALGGDGRLRRRLLSIRRRPGRHGAPSNSASCAASNIGTCARTKAVHSATANWRACRSCAGSINAVTLIRSIPHGTTTSDRYFVKVCDSLGGGAQGQKEVADGHTARVPHRPSAARAVCAWRRRPVPHAHSMPALP